MAAAPWVPGATQRMLLLDRDVERGYRENENVRPDSDRDPGRGQHHCDARRVCCCRRCTRCRRWPRRPSRRPSSRRSSSGWRPSRATTATTRLHLSTTRWSAVVADYCGAQKLAEALLGWDLLGFHPDSAWRADGLGLDAQGKPVATHVYGVGYPAEPQGPVRGGGYGQRLPPRRREPMACSWIPPGIGAVGPLAPRTYVLCDVFPVRERKLRLPDGKIVSPGMPILYYKANPASKVLVPGAGERDAAGSADLQCQGQPGLGQSGNAGG